MPIRSDFRSYLDRISHLFNFAASAVFLCSALCSAQSKVAGEGLGDITGMYTFLHDGEFVQITLDELPTPRKQKVPVTGFISRLGASESDKDQVLDLWIQSGTLEGARIAFATKAIHGLSYEFIGAVRRGTAKARHKEGFIVVEGTLVERTIDRLGKPRSRRRELTLKSFPNLDDDSGDR